MKLSAFLLKEWYNIRRNIAVLLVILLILPTGAAIGTAAFNQTIPEHIPIGVTAANDNVNDADLEIIEAGTTLYATPERYDSRANAERALEREDVYFVIQVPDNLFQEDAQANVTVISDNRITPFQEPANYTAAILQYQLNQQFPADVNVKHERIGTEIGLSEYLSPTALILTVLLAAFVYLPFELYREQNVFERVDLTDRIETAVLAKLITTSILLLLPLTIFQLIGYQLAYRVTYFQLGTMGILLLTFIYTAAISTGIMFITRLSRSGLFLNLGVLTGIIAFSSLIYPVGFFSEIRKTIALHLPTHHSMVITRSTMLKDIQLSAFTGEIAWIIGFTICTLLAVQVTITHYRHTR